MRNLHFVTLVSVNKGRHGFGGQKCAHTSSKSLTIQQVFSVAFSSSGHISAPSKLLCTWQGWIFEWFLFFETQMCRSPIIQIKAQRSGFDLRRKKEIAECSFCRKAEAERCKLLLTRRKEQKAPKRRAVRRVCPCQPILMYNFVNLREWACPELQSARCRNRRCRSKVW